MQDRRNSYREWFAQHLAAQGTCPPGRKSTAPSHGPIGTPTSPREYHLSPTTDSSATPASVAPLSWFELLASDAANVDRGFVLSPPQSAPSAVAPSPPVNPLLQSPDLKTYTRREHESIQAASFHNDLETEPNLVPAIENPSSVLPDEPFTWNTAAPIQLSAQERRLFHHFVRNLSPVIDFFDIMKHFTTLVPHLALHNIGLMKSLLALSARHLSLHKDYANVAPLDDTGAISFLPIDRNVAVQYYYETLQYLNNVMQYPTYACSQELIATATLISTYEMLDGSNRDWERHIKGVFWIQRYQNNDGESGGLRQAVWWAWLRQDLWVGMRERRRVFSFWRPRRHISLLTAPELAHRAVYLLSQCVNYASREESETTDRQHRLERGNELLGMLQEWHDHLPQEYNPLPPIQNSDIFPPIWVCPPPYAAALQKHSLARVLVVLNRPSMGDPQDFRAGQNLLAESVNTICGISRTVNTDDIGAILTALPCLYGGKFC